jgi:hypothetical protein
MKRGRARQRAASAELAMRISLAMLIAVSLTGCFGPEERRPGMRLPGGIAPTPSDWSFTDDHPLIAIEVRTPYLLPHSVTIVCGSLDGNLYVGARDPETKRWPGWVDDDPEVRLGIGDRVYEGRLEPITDEALIARVRQAMATKYDRPPASGEVAIRYWQVVPRTQP